MKLKLFILILTLSLLGLCSCSKATEMTDTQATEEETAAVETENVLTESETQETETTLPEAEVPPAPSDAEVSILHLYATVINTGVTAGDPESYKGRSYVTYPAFTLTQEDALRYPGLKSALDDLNSRCEKEYTDYLLSASDIAAEAAADDTDMQIEFFDCLTPEIRRADSHILSILENYDTYTGGAHGYYAFYGDNFDPATGKELFLQDVITDMDSFRETVKEKLYAQYPNVGFDDLDTALADMDTADHSVMPWSMDYSGITLYFNPYHLASYADGMQVITVPFNESPGLFAKEYLDVPKAYVQQLNSLTPAVLDVNGDDMNEAVFVTGEAAEETADEAYEEGYSGGYRNLTVCCGGEEVTISDQCFSATSYLVRANDQYYVYIFEISDNDYSLCTVVDLKTMKNDPSRTFNAFLTGLGSDYDYDDTGYRSVISKYMFTDPACIPLSSRIEVLGSSSGAKLYKTDSDGWPVTSEKSFNVSSAAVLTAKQDISCVEVDENGSEISDAVLSSGRYYVLVRTDNKSWADLQEVKDGEYTKQSEYPYIYIDDVNGIRDDRPIYRLPYNGDTWPKTINGIDEEKLFDGILYAG